MAEQARSAVHIPAISVSAPARRALEKLLVRLDNGPLASAATVLIGSACVEGLWRATSDIDLCIFVEDMTGQRLFHAAEELAQSLLEIVGTPRVIVDLQQPRIEGYLSVNGFTFDVTWMSEPPRVGDSDLEIINDNLELYIGNLYRHGLLLQGSLPAPPCEGGIAPFYGEGLRERRLAAVLRYLDRSCRTEEAVADRTMAAILPALAEAQRIFLQAVCIAGRTYPLSYVKHLRYQLEELFHFNRQTIDFLWPADATSPERMQEVPRRWLEFARALQLAKDREVTTRRCS